MPLAFAAPSFTLTFVEAYDPYDRVYARMVYDMAVTRDIPSGQHLENVEVVLGAVSQSRAAQLNSKTLSLLSSNVKDVIWQIVEKESVFVGNRWKEIDWDATIKKYPDMSKPNSDLFKEVTAELKTLHGNNAAEVTVRRKVMNMVYLCFGG
ncbi:hypothetical protein N0V92_011782 [Colletotrichum tropicale]|nr:hypothetical protein N0V92_011782 [Colletotrichum tropicale]